MTENVLSELLPLARTYQRDDTYYYIERVATLLVDVNSESPDYLTVIRNARDKHYNVAPTRVFPCGQAEAKPMFNRVECNPRILGGTPIVRGTRIPVSTILACVADGYSRKEIRQEYPRLTDEDIAEALLYASTVVEQVRRKGGPGDATHFAR